MSEPRLPHWKRTVVLGVGVLGLCFGTGGAEAPTAPAPSKPAALQVDKSAPLLLDEPAEEEVPKADPRRPVADNNRCFVCHVNYKEEPFVQWHSQANVSCVQCHGDSAEHIADEANLTPPGRIYQRSMVGFNCFGCHPKHNAPAREVVLRWQERVAGKVNPKRVICTDCHGDHRLKLRTIVWDKRTRALLSKISTNAPSRATAPHRVRNPDGPMAADLPSPSTAHN